MKEFLARKVVFSRTRIFPFDSNMKHFSFVFFKKGSSQIKISTMQIPKPTKLEPELGNADYQIKYFSDTMPKKYSRPFSKHFPSRKNVLV